MPRELKVKYFVPFDGLMGKIEFIHVREGTKREDIFGVLSMHHKGFASSKLTKSLVVLVNGQMCGADYMFEKGDEVSIFTAVAGG